MDIKKRIMTESPLNAEPPIEALRSWITPNKAFFNRNQGAIPAVSYTHLTLPTIYSV